METKICKSKNGCWKEKLLEEFVRDKYCRDGFKSICLDCSKKYYRDNKEEIDAKCAKYYTDNKEKIYVRHAEYAENNKEKMKIISRKYAKNNKEKLRLNSRKHYLENIEQIKIRHSKYKKDNPDIVRAHRRKRRAQKKIVNENYTTQDEKITYEIFNNKCFNCNISDNLSIDHHYCLNDGNPLSVDNAVVLCIPCNSSKGTKTPEKFYTKQQLIKIIKLFRLASKMK